MIDSGPVELAVRAALFSAFAVIGPGAAVLRLLRLQIEPALVIPLGLVHCAGWHWLGLRLGQPWLFPAVTTALALSLLPRWQGRTDLAQPALRSALPPMLALVALLAASEYPFNRLRADGVFLVDPLRKIDDALHVGLAWELSQSASPQAPGFAGFEFDYHLGWPLVRAAALRFAGIHPYDSLSRLEPTLVGAALVLALRAATIVLGGGRFAVALAPWTLLASGGGFLLGGGRDVWLARDVAAFSNSLYPAAALVLASAVALHRYALSRARGWLALCALLSLATPLFKVFAGAHLVAALALAALMTRERPIRRALLLSLAATAAATAALALLARSDVLRVGLEPFLWAEVDRRWLGREPLAGWRFGVWSAAWLVCGLGVRLLGAAWAVHGVGRREGPAALVALIGLVGWPVATTLSITHVSYEPGRTVHNEALYFMHLSNVVLGALTAVAIERLTRPGLKRAVTLVACAALGLVGTVQYATARVQTRQERVPADVLHAMAVLSAATQPGEVVMQHPRGRRPPPPPVVFAGRRIPYTGFYPYPTQFASPAVLERRLDRVTRFFETDDPAEAARIAASLRATHVCLFGADRLGFPEGSLLDPIYEGDVARVLAIRRP